MKMPLKSGKIHTVLQADWIFAVILALIVGMPPAFAAKPKSKIHFFFVKNTGKADRETGKDIFLLQKRVEIEAVQHDEDDGKIIVLVPEKGRSAPEKAKADDIGKVVSIRFGFRTREIAHEKKELFEESPSELVVFGEKDEAEGSQDLKYVRILLASPDLMKAALGGQVLADDVKRGMNLARSSDEGKLRAELLKIEERAKRFHAKKMDYYTRNNKLLSPLSLEKKLHEVEKKLGKLKVGDSQIEDLELKKEALEELIYEGPQAALGQKATAPSTESYVAGRNGSSGPRDSQSPPAYDQAPGDLMMMDCNEGRSGGSGNFYCDLSTARATQVNTRLGGGHGNATLEDLEIRMVSLSGGKFQMGSSTSEAERLPNETQHEVTLSSFEMMDAAVTQKTYALVTGHNPSHFKKSEDCKGLDGQTDYEVLHVNGRTVKVCADHPVESVTWNNAQSFILQLNERVKATGYKFKLPTEAQYEYAFRGGATTAYVSGDTKSDLGDYVWFSENSGKRTHAVRSKKANDFGIHRSSVWNWAEDWYGEYPTASVTDPVGPSSGSNRVIRGGGSWNDAAGRCRSAQRHYAAPGRSYGNLGFSLARTH